ncbi:pilus assembly protein [Mesorhizobium sp. M8A.F.Ca.ET.173.01.1.1]|uniref:TadE/TadG family type IV pilus assembly protein n=1 Tax=Mesorhizobium sp. M8A.F.Ca.ET.207.01.1.1 TaxID=2563968 RepID=UPI000FD5A302|nr:TadE/TadG family type IV pilus assembly protein [Mesorhizobium sp. M8A.F.Ca.ET.207.01.1.1]RUW90420.1 pilus assembly protein [Mesorhizobium sp. M8A.F.Ca.ET.023.01.1.1]RWC70013.1 MAG: pilus assembly protein [Mesorhizobium sp.]TGV14140.1 pilus assembly protein [Mesorhizobium sp. M8A.F.Ca.ET.173.01.1.1]TGQ79918.1 pilus assembly protein [Mesorhizobium sp. M8A.F.Ca.ET.207.01.1.1]TIT68096.1 MAG: pilus assembly protein [Mesorhizobium sp.]
MVISRGTFWRDHSGATMVEAAIAMPMLLTLLLGFVDFGYAFYQWNAGNKAVQAGARLAQISTPVAVGLPLEGLTQSDVSKVGTAVPAGTYDYTCTASAAGVACCSIGAGTCLPANASQASFDAIYDGTANRAGMHTFLPMLVKSEVQIEYAASGLGYWTRPSGPVPTITVSIQNHPFQFFFLAGFLRLGTITMPSMLSTVTGEDMKSTYP